MRPKTKHPRHEVISVRLNQDRLALLERHRAALTSQLSREVSLAEAAFLAIEDRAVGLDRAASRHEMLQAPTAALGRIRKRWESEHALSVAEWDVIAEYVLVSTEEERQEPPRRRPAAPSRESYLALVDAFEAVYQNRIKPASPRAGAYLGHLAGVAAPAKASAGDADKQHRAVLKEIARQRTQLQDEANWERPGNIGRCLLVAIREEGLDGATLDRVLSPHWTTLWGLAARGHWIRHDHLPIQSAEGMDEDVRREIDLPDPMTADDITVTFDSKGRPDLVTVIDFGPTRQFSITLSRYPELVEFRAMLDGIPDPLWSGRYFRTAIWNSTGVKTFRLEIKASDVLIQLSEREWAALHGLFQKGWERPEVARWLLELRQEYGEHG